MANRTTVRPSEERARALAAELDLDLQFAAQHRELIAQMLVNRGVDSPEGARKYLQPRLGDLRRPDGVDGKGEMAGFRVAVERLQRAIAEKQTIGIFGDYDVDGVTSCALLTIFLRSANARTVSRVAQRSAGYGFTVGDVSAFGDAGCAVIVTCDCGTSDHEALAAAKSSGIDVIIVDHHQVPDRQPEALALINPHQTSCQFPFKGLASVGVAFYLAAALRTRLQAAGVSAMDPRELTDLVAVGTIADLAPLAEENRILTHAGTLRLMRNERPGLRALAQVAGLPHGVERSSQIAFRISPRLNAPGRLGDATLALDLLLADESSAEKLAEACEDANLRRQKLQEHAFKEAMTQARELLDQGDPPVLVVAGENWAPGVVGIVAAKLVDAFRRPTFVLALEELGGRKVARGSARSIAGFHLVEALKSVAPLFGEHDRYGGHAQAAGLTITATRVVELRQALCDAFRAQIKAPPQAQWADAELDLEAIDFRLAEALSRLEPFGMGNPEPCFVTAAVTLERTRVVGSTHLQVTFRQGTGPTLVVRDGIGFGLAERDPGAGARVRATFVPELDHFRGERRVRMRVKDLETLNDE